jgi:rare lipoprotein A (peptidoglycan hydrolase)
MSDHGGDRDLVPAFRRTRPSPHALFLLSLVTLLVAADGGCAARRVPTATEGPWEGNASWYGVEFHGRRAADGSRFNMYELTAAHRTLPFGTRLRVTNLRNGRTVKVTVTDRGPFVEGRIIDLSFAAAQQLGMVGGGVTPVRLELID